MNNESRSGGISPVEAVVDDISHDGNGVARVNDRVYFIAGVLPGERIQFRPGKKRKGKYEGTVVSILEPSEFRTAPLCEYFGICGGCVLQHASTEAQLKTKEKTLFETLKRIGRVRPNEFLEPIHGTPWHYRTKARLGIKMVPKKGGILVGFRERNSSFITSLDSCKTLDRRISDLLPSLHQLVSELSNNNRIPQLEVAAGDSQVAIVLRHMEPVNAEDIELLKAFARDAGVSIYLQPGGLDSIAPLWPESSELLRYQLPEFGLSLEFSPTDFTQVNPEVNQLMVSRAVKYLAPESGDNILDLFCGLGNFTLALGKSGARVAGIEGDEALVSRGEHNAKLNEMDNVSFHALDLHSEVGELPDQLLTGQHFNKFILDPPRSGAFEVVSNLVPNIKPERLVYISCNPATLARDANVMVHNNGYTLSYAGAIDMFPHTAHVESMAVFTKLS